MTPREYWPRPPDVSHLSDEELVALARQNREEGFRGIVRRYEPLVMARIYDLVRDHDLTDDLTQTTWIKAFAALHHHDPDRNFSAWLLRIACNTAIDHLRHKRPHTVPVDTTFEHSQPSRQYGLPRAPVAGRTASREARLAAREQAINQALRELSRAQRRCVRLLYYEQRSCQDIARLLDLPLGTVKTHLNRAREKLERLLDPLTAAWLTNSLSSDPFYSPPP